MIALPLESTTKKKHIQLWASKLSFCQPVILTNIIEKQMDIEQITDKTVRLLCN